MKKINILILVMCVYIIRNSCSGADFSDFTKNINVGSRYGRVFVSTNDSCMPFYVTPSGIDVSLMIGKIYDTNILNYSKILIVSQYVPHCRTIDGRVVDNSYVLNYTRLAVLTNHVLTLSDIKIEISDNDAQRGVVLSADVHSVIVQVDNNIISKINEQRALLKKEPDR
jgi:hypothetical protein